MTKLTARIGIIVALLALFLCAPARAIEIKEVTSPGGIKAWLVQSSKLPIISIDFSFAGGASAEPDDARGAAALMARLMNDGAGTYTSEAFRARKEDLSFSLTFWTSHDHVSGSFSTLSKNSTASFNLFQAAVNAPRFDDEPFQRRKRDLITQIKQASLEQESIAQDKWLAQAFPNHPYGKPVMGTESSMGKVTQADLKSLHRRLFSKASLKVAAAGDITPEALGLMLDQVFGQLSSDRPAQAPTLASIMQGPLYTEIAYDGPQTVVYFGMQNINEHSERGWAASLLAELLGGGASFARLTEELREKRGLTYSVYMGETKMPLGGFMLGSLSTANASAKQAVALLKEQLLAMATTGPTDEELRKVKAYVNGSYALRFTSTSAISQAMLSAQEVGWSPDFISDRAKNVNAVSIETIRQVAAELLREDALVMTVVGRPE
jgi:zinc protease